MDWIDRWRNLFFGGKDTDTLEMRSFASVSLISLILLALLLVVNLVLGMYIPSLLVAGGILILLGVFYLGRSHSTFPLAITLFTIFTLGLITTNFFVNDGFSGPSLYYLLLTFVLLIAVVPKPYLWLLIAAHLLLGAGLLYIDFYHPGYILSLYQDEATRYLDHAISYAVILIFIYVLIRNIRSYFEQQKIKVENTARQLKQQEKVTKRQNQRLENINRVQSRLLSVLSHDVRSPLHSIIGLMELMYAGELSVEEQHIMTGKLLKTAKQTDIMLVNLLQWSKSQLEGFEPNLKEESIVPLAETILQPLRTAAAVKKVQLQTDIEPALLHTDKEMIQLVIRNLVNNALKYTEEGGQVACHGIHRENGYRIEVSDTGTGIPESMHESLFTEQTISQAGTHQEKGTGIGLILVHEFVQMLGGTISFTSAEGKGTTFYVDLPLRP